MADAVSSLQVVVEGKDETTKVLKGIESSIIRFVGAVSASLAAVSVAVYPVKATATFQRELLNVGKTTEFTDAQLTTLGDGLKQLSYQLNISAEDLAKIAAAGGQMGLSREGVSGLLIFTEAASRMASVLDISAEDSGNAIARLTNIFKIAISDAERISSLLNEMSNNSTANGADLIDMIQRIGTAGGTLNLQQSAALAATGRDLGLTVETVGTSFNKIFLSLQTNAEAIAPVLGMPVEKFAALVKSDGIAALKLYIDALNQMGEVQKATFAQQTTGGGRIFALVTSLAKDASTGYEVLNRNIASAAKGYLTGTSAIKEQERVMSGLIAQGIALQNVFIGIAEAVGRRALPYLTRMTKQLQDWAKDPAFLEFFDRMGTYIGTFADAILSAIKTLSGLSAVMGPLLTLLQVFLGMKIVGGLLGITAALVRQGKAAADATKAWYGLLTANKETVKSVAAAARELDASNAAAAGTGKTTKSVSAAGKIATYLDSSLSSKFAMQEQLVAQTAKMGDAEKLLNERTQQRLTVLGGIKAEMEQITATQKAQVQAAYDSVIAAGGTKKAANAAKTETKASLNRRMLDLTVAESSLDMAYDNSLKRREANLKSIANQATTTQQSLANLSSFGLVFASLRTTILSAASAVGVFLMRFVAIGGAIAAVLGVVTFFLDLFGVLDPVIAGLKKILGIADSAKVEQERLAAERTAAMEEEKRKAAELAKVYDAQAESRAKAVASSSSGNVLNGSLAREISTLQTINGKYADLTFKAADIASSTSLVETQWKAVNRQLAEAKAKYAELSAQQQQEAQLKGGAGATPFGIKTGVSEKEVSTAKVRVDDLTRSLDLLSKARERFQTDATDNNAEMAKVAAEAAAQAERLAPLFDEGGIAALKAFERVLEGQQKLDASKKALVEAEKTGNSAKASDEDKTAFILAAQNVKVLEQELKVLQTSYDELKLSSAGATVFMANAFPDAAKATVEKVRALIRILGSVGEETNAALETSKTSIDKQIKEIDDKLAEVERKRKARLSNLEDIPDKQAPSYTKAVSSINADAAKDAYPISNRLADLKAQQAQMALEGVEAARLKGAYEALGDAKKAAQDKGRGLVSNFSEVAALKALTDLQIAAQKKVEDGARFNAENIKKLYEEAKANLASVVNDSKKELASLGQYFNSRAVTLKIAKFDFNANRDNEQYKALQTETLALLKQQLESQGLSSEEIAKQLGMMQEAFAWEDKMRVAFQEEARQRMIIGEIQRQMAEDQKTANEASAKAVEYARQSKEYAEAGNQDKAAEFAKKAREESERAKIAVEDLTEKTKEFKNEAAKPVQTVFGPKYVVSDEEVKAQVEATTKARVAQAQASESALAQASAAATKEHQDQEARLGALKQKAEDYQKTLTEIAKLAPELGKAQEAIAAKVLAGTEGMTAITDSLKSIANSDFRGLDQFSAVAAQSEKIDAMSQSIKEVARTYADSIVPVGASIADTSKAVVDNLKQSAELGAEVVNRLNTVLAANPATASVAFPDAAKALQEQLKDKNFVANVAFTSGGGANIQKNAEGGPIRGPGTGTSDSILSWVSNGEYINDAQTTSFFGENFFAALKSIARGGKIALSNFSTKVSGGLSLPAFAGGGYIGSSLVGAGGGIVSLMPQSNDAILGRYAVDLNVGGDKVSLLGERSQVDTLVKALHKMNRG